MELTLDCGTLGSLWRKLNVHPDRRWLSGVSTRLYGRNVYPSRSFVRSPRASGPVSMLGGRKAARVGDRTNSRNQAVTQPCISGGGTTVEANANRKGRCPYNHTSCFNGHHVTLNDLHPKQHKNSADSEIRRSEVTRHLPQQGKNYRAAVCMGTESIIPMVVGGVGRKHTGMYAYVRSPYRRRPSGLEYCTVVPVCTSLP